MEQSNGFVGRNTVRASTRSRLSFIFLAAGIGPREAWAFRVSHIANETTKDRISLAVVGATAAPFVFHTYKKFPVVLNVWSPLTVEEKDYGRRGLRKRTTVRRIWVGKV